MNLTTSRRYIQLQTPTGAIRNPLRLEGMKYNRESVQFDAGLWSVNQAAIVSTALLGSEAIVNLGADRPARRRFEASPAHLEAINARHAERTLTEEDVYIFQRVPVNNIASRTVGIRFTDRALDKFTADSVQGRARLRGHVKTDLVGRVFAGEVIEEEVRGLSARWLLTTEYISRRTIDGAPMNSELITQVANGELSYDSIGFYPGSRVDFREVDAGGRKLSVIEIDYDASEQFPLEYREVSFVHLGELRGVGSRKLTEQNNADEEFAGLVIINQSAVDVTGHKKKSRWDISV